MLQKKQKKSTLNIDLDPAIFATFVSWWRTLRWRNLEAFLRFEVWNYFIYLLITNEVYEKTHSLSHTLHHSITDNVTFGCFSHISFVCEPIWTFFTVLPPRILFHFWWLQEWKCIGLGFWIVGPCGPCFS